MFKKSKFFIAVMFKNLNYRTVDDWWTSIQFKIGACISHIALFFYFLIALVTAFEIRFGTRQFSSLFPKRKLYFRRKLYVRRQITAEAKLS